jgi:hypothetical protein
MRKIIAIVALLCGAASVEAGTSRYYTSYCSNGFEQPAVISADGEVKIGDAVQKEDDADQFLADVTIYSDGQKRSAIIYRDRVFWPCKD